MAIVYLNGNFIPQEEAKISPMDRGFLFGDGVYEVIPVYNRKIFRFKQHIDRLHRSLAAIQLNFPCDYKAYNEIFDRLLRDNLKLGENQSIYLQITRGFTEERNHAFPKKVEPTIFAYTTALRTLSYEELKQGKSVITLEDTRWQHCNIKATSLLANVLLYQQAIAKGAAETILIRGNQAIEGATSNLFIVKDNFIKTPPLSDAILGGVTRDLVLELAKQEKLPHAEAPIQTQELFTADEVWITSSTREIYPIIKVDETIIGDGTPGPIWRHMIEKYHLFIKSL